MHSAIYIYIYICVIKQGLKTDILFKYLVWIITMTLSTNPLIFNPLLIIPVQIQYTIVNLFCVTFLKKKINAQK